MRQVFASLRVVQTVTLPMATSKTITKQMINIQMIIVVIVCNALYFGSQSFAQDFPEPNPRLQSLLENGEYGAAVKLANEAADPKLKNRMLAAIAKSQSSNRMGPQSMRSVASISDDVVRRAVLNQVRPAGGFGGLPFPAGGVANGGPQAGANGGAAIADFDPLIELIQNTVDPQSWLDTNGGPGTINEFRAGVSVDARGELRRVKYSEGNGLLKDIRKESIRRELTNDLLRDSGLRKVSLNRLEKECQLLAAQGKPPTAVMNHLAGIYEIKYLLVYPDTGDVVIAGPAGEWKTDVEGTSVNVKTGRPLFRLDDLVVVLRNAMESGGSFGCSIDPREANLRATQEFISTSKLKGKPWRDGLRTALGIQDISVDGIDPDSIAARVIVEADYRMKLVGMDLEKGVPGVESFLSRVQLVNGQVPPTDVMRLEFVLNYDKVTFTEAKDAFQLEGQGVKVVSEKELLNRRGERIHTGRSEGPAAEFARGFTKHFGKMAKQYPIYAQLKNVFDLAMVANLIRMQKLDEKCNWNLTYFGPPRKGELAYEIQKGHIPREVKTVMNYREIDERKGGRKVRTHLLVGISGGVTFDARKYLSEPESLRKDTYGLMEQDRKAAMPAGENWWWD